MTDGGYDVFISYARVDSARARLIRDKLAALGLQVFFDTEGIETGEEFPVIIDRAVKGAKCVLGLWSRAAFSGRWVRIESRIGLDQRKLVAATLDSMRPEELPAEFYNVNVESLASYQGQDDHAGWGRIVRAIGKRVGRPDLAQTLAAPSPTASPPSLTSAQRRNILIAGGGAAAVVLLLMLNPFHLGPKPADASVGAAPTSTPAADLTGAWTGAYSEDGRETPFQIEFRSTLGGVDGGAHARRFVGQASEPNVFGIGGAQYLYANISGEARPGGVIRFVKTYNGAGGVSHTVRYEGRIDDGGRTITGTWDTGALQGPFRMDRD